MKIAKIATLIAAIFFLLEVLYVPSCQPAVTPQVDTSSWTTYKNVRLGYEFKYPKGWFVRTIDNHVILTSSPNTEEYYSHGAREPRIGSMGADFAPGSCISPSTDYHSTGGLHGIVKIVCVGNTQFALELSDQDPDLKEHKALLETIPTTFTFLPLSQKVNYEKLALSWLYIHGPKNAKVRVYLYAPDQTSSVNQSLWGFATEGEKNISGNYRLIVDPTPARGGSGVQWTASQIYLGLLQFNPKRPPTDGKLHSLQVDPNGYIDAVAFYQYGSSNTDAVSVYRYVSDKLALIHFLSKDYAKQDFTETGLGGELQSNPDGTFTSQWYDNSRGYVTTKWNYSPKDNNFHEIETKVSTNP